MKSKFKKFYRHLISAIKEEVILELEEKIISTETSQEFNLDKPMSALEISELYGLHLSTLNRYVRLGLKVHSKGKNCKRFFTRKDFNEFITKNKRRNG